MRIGVGCSQHKVVVLSLLFFILFSRLVVVAGSCGPNRSSCFAKRLARRKTAMGREVVQSAHSIGSKSRIELIFFWCAAGGWKRFWICHVCYLLIVKAVHSICLERYGVPHWWKKRCFFISSLLLLLCVYLYRKKYSLINKAQAV